MKAVNVCNLLICQIESTTTIRDIELITASKGVDCLWGRAHGLYSILGRWRATAVSGFIGRSPKYWGMSIGTATGNLQSLRGQLSGRVVMDYQGFNPLQPETETVVPS